MEKLEDFSEEEPADSGAAAQPAILESGKELDKTLPAVNPGTLSRGEMNHENRLARIESTLDKLAAIVLRDSSRGNASTKATRLRFKPLGSQ